MLQNAYLLAKIGADTAENERIFAEILPTIGNYPTGYLRDSALVHALEKYDEAEDRRLRDAVRSALFKLVPEDASSIGASPSVKRYDLFLSHKQSDAKDFVRALHTMLSVHGYRCFLDVEFDGELGSLAEIVAQSGQVLFILTDKVLESPWCITELSAAVDHNIPVTVVKKEGARWIDPDSGARCLNFPSYAEINRLPEKIRPIFQIKIVEHSDTYYAPFIEKLFERIALPDLEDDIGDEPMSIAELPSIENDPSSGPLKKFPSREMTKRESFPVLERASSRGSVSARPSLNGNTLPPFSLPSTVNHPSPSMRAESMVDKESFEALMNRLDNLEKLVEKIGERALVSNFLLGLVVGALVIGALRR
jgi:hypothetical protein